MKGFALGLAAMIALGCGRQAGAQESVADFYKGKQLQIRVGSAAGSGYDLVGRVVGRHIGRHIPGDPTIVVQNVPGAGSLTLANQLYNLAPKDGSVIGIVTNGMPTAPLFTPDTARFDPSKFGWIGSPAPETQVVMVWHTAPVQTVGDLFRKELIVGAVAPGTATVDVPLVTNAILGTKFKIVSGYAGTSQIDLAMERGEVQGHAAIGWVSAKTRNVRWLKDGTVKVIAQYGFRKHPDLPNVPLFELPKKEADRQAIVVMFARQEYGRPLLAPPGVPADRLTALRRAFDATMKDPEFLADAGKSRLEINPVTGEELDKLTAQIVATKPAVAERLRTILNAPNAGKPN